MKVGIIGFGTVGKALRSAIIGCDVLINDPIAHDESNSLHSLSCCDWIFVCVSTEGKENGEFDSTAIDSVMEAVYGYNPAANIVIKSTVLPTKVDEYTKMYGDFLVCPEFLRDASASYDILDPKFRIIGGDKTKAEALQEFFRRYSICGDCPVGYCTAIEAATAKYAINCFLAVKVIFMNQLQEIFENITPTGKWENFIDILKMDSRMGNSHFDVPGPDGYGYGGKCFPKDTKAMIHLARSLNIPFTVVEEADNHNMYLNDFEHYKGSRHDSKGGERRKT